MSVTNFIRSPCIGVCSTTALGDDICVGCRRTAEEVRDWNTYKSDQKLKINNRLKRDSRIIINNGVLPQ